jgi:hypothetical protein
MNTPKSAPRARTGAHILVRAGVQETPPPCFICGEPRPWDQGWPFRMNPSPERDRVLKEHARCDNCHEVEGRLRLYLKSEKGRTFVQEALKKAKT